MLTLRATGIFWQGGANGTIVGESSANCEYSEPSNGATSGLSQGCGVLKTSLWSGLTGTTYIGMTRCVPPTIRSSVSCLRRHQNASL